MAIQLKEGDKAPDFSLEDQYGKKVSLKSLKGKNVILYFYPRDDTPGCTIEACSFRDDKKEFDKLGAVVLGVSLDNAESHQKFTGKYSLNFQLLVDKDAEVSKAYGVYDKKSLYGRIFNGITRATFIIGKDGKIKKIFPKVQVDGHSKEIINLLKEAR